MVRPRKISTFFRYFRNFGKEPRQPFKCDVSVTLSFPLAWSSKKLKVYSIYLTHPFLSCYRSTDYYPTKLDIEFTEHALDLMDSIDRRYRVASLEFYAIDEIGVRNPGQ